MYVLAPFVFFLSVDRGTTRCCGTGRPADVTYKYMYEKLLYNRSHHIMIVHCIQVVLHDGQERVLRVAAHAVRLAAARDVRRTRDL